MTITDEIAGSYRTAVARFHLHPDVTATVSRDGRSGELALASGCSVAWSVSVPARIEPITWSPEFGKTLATTCLAVKFDGPDLQTVFVW